MHQPDSQLEENLGEQNWQNAFREAFPHCLNRPRGTFYRVLNDVNGEMIYAQQLYGYGKKGDVFIGISTSGNAEECDVCRCRGKRRPALKTIGLTKNGGRWREACDCSIVVPSDETFKIQELHLPIYHTLCLMLEEHFYEV